MKSGETIQASFKAVSENLVKPLCPLQSCWGLFEIIPTVSCFKLVPNVKLYTIYCKATLIIQWLYQGALEWKQGNQCTQQLYAYTLFLGLASWSTIMGPNTRANMPPLHAFMKLRSEKGQVHVHTCILMYLEAFVIVSCPDNLVLGSPYKQTSMSFLH